MQIATKALKKILLPHNSSDIWNSLEHRLHEDRFGAAQNAIFILLQSNFLSPVLTCREYDSNYLQLVLSFHKIKVENLERVMGFVALAG